MQIYLDDQSLDIVNSNQNLESVLQTILSEHVADGNMIWTVKINGMYYHEHIPHEASTIYSSDIETLEIGTKTKKEIVKDFLNNSKPLIGIINASALKIADLFRRDDKQIANQHYSNFLESYKSLFQMIQQSIDMLPPDFQKVFVNGTDVPAKIHDLEVLLNKMIDIQQRNDWLSLADVLEHELPPVLTLWQNALPVLEKMQ